MEKKIAIVAAWIGNRPPEISRVESNHRDYADFHGYSYHLYDDTMLSEIHAKVGNAADAHWIKPEVIELALKNHHYVFWSDLDSVFHDRTKSLQDLIDLDKDFVFTGDHNDLCNGGHLLFRQSDWTTKFLRDWHSLRFLIFPNLYTSMQGNSGHVGDQVALNYLLGGGQPTQDEVTKTASEIFNSTNGWVGNPERLVGEFGKKIGPTTKRNLPRSRDLIATSLRDHVEVVAQKRLNSYPWWTSKSTSARKGPIIHFVSPYKGELMAYLDGNQPSTFGAVSGLVGRAKAKFQSLFPG